MADAAALPLPSFAALIGLRLSIVRRAADMLVLHFGVVVPHRSGRGDVGQMAFHVEGPWRLDDAERTLVGRDDLWAFGGEDPAPEGWSYEDGGSVQDIRFSDLFERREGRYGWAVVDNGYLVSSADVTSTGDVKITFANGVSLLVFSDGVSRECWRLFDTGSDADHLVFPLDEQAWRSTR
jgi:hypothetical protein